MAEHYLSINQRSTINALAVILFEPHRPDAFQPEQVDLGGMLSEYLGDMEVAMRKGLGVLITLFNLLPLLFIGRLSTFKKLSHDDARRYVAKWNDCPIYPLRMGFLGIRTLTSVLFFEQQEVLAEVGWSLRPDDSLKGMQ